MIQNLEAQQASTLTTSPIQSPIPNQQRNKLGFGVGLWSFALVAIIAAASLIGTVIRIQFSVMEELKNERASRVAAEERNSKLIERITNQIMTESSQNQLSVLSSLTQIYRDQATSVEKLQMTVQELLREKKIATKNMKINKKPH